MRAAWARREPLPPLRRGPPAWAVRAAPRPAGGRPAGEGERERSALSSGWSPCGGQLGHRGHGSPLAGTLGAELAPAGVGGRAGCKQKGLGRRSGSSPSPHTHTHTQSLAPQTKLSSSPDLSSAPRAQTARFPERKMLRSCLFLSSKIRRWAMSLGSPFFWKRLLAGPQPWLGTNTEGSFAAL